MKFRGRGKSAPIFRLTDVMQRGYFQQVRFFVDLGIELDVADDDGRTPLMLCAFLEPEEWGTGIARLLIEKGATLDNVDKYGMNVMHLASIYVRVELAKVLLQAIDFDLTEGDRWGNTPLHYAVRAGSVPLVTLLVRSHAKYKISMEKKNRDGLTPYMEAQRFSHRRCAEVIGSVDDLSETDMDFICPPPLLNLKMSRETVRSRTTSERSFPVRPKTAFVGRRGSVSSSSSASSLYLAQRPIFVKEFSGAKKDKLPNEKDFSRIVRCASLSDFRNNPEYLYNLTMPGVIPANGIQTGSRPVNVRPKSEYVRRVGSVSSENAYFSWRVEFKKLFVHYEYQCTPSYRDAAKYIPCDLPYLDENGSPQPFDDGDETDRGKRSKRVSSAISKTGCGDSKEKQRKQSQNQKRKTSAVHGTHGHEKQSSTSLDGSHGSSSESLSSSGISSKKQHSGAESQNQKTSKEKTTNQGSEGHGRQSRVSHYNKNIPAVSVMDNADTQGGEVGHSKRNLDQNRLIAA